MSEVLPGQVDRHDSVLSSAARATCKVVNLVIVEGRS